MKKRNTEHPVDTPDCGFADFFQQATAGRSPFPYQIQLACGSELPQLLDVPTGLGKTAAAILSWLFRRRRSPDEDVRRKTPRRLVYCLPMRTLVEQTVDEARQWLARLEMRDVGVHALMGGVESDEWDCTPEGEAILVGTQDMLLSRALNRGYGMSRYRWPVHFALLNNDALWVMDETQLMGVGLTTSVQLQGLRNRLSTYGVSHSLWMSATLDVKRLRTVDHPMPEGGFATHRLSRDDREHPVVRQRLTARKPLKTASASLTAADKKTYPGELAAQVATEHNRRPGTLTLVILNRVQRAQDVYSRLSQHYGAVDSPPELSLIHARFRPADRKKSEELLLSGKVPPAGHIAVATQAIEAGVDISAATMFTESAPWSSLVQRFGRCNRAGEFGSGKGTEAAVFWIDIETLDSRSKPNEELALPYPPAELERSRTYLSRLTDVGPETLGDVTHEAPQPLVHTLRRKDLLDLFDTTPDLGGNDLDVSRYIRDSDDTDVQVYWRDWEIQKKSGRTPPPQPKSPDGTIQFPTPARAELCTVSVAAMRDFIGKLRKNDQAKHLTWQWNLLDRKWEECGPRDIRPGAVVLLHGTAGGYDAKLGWTGDPRNSPITDLRAVVEPAGERAGETAMEDDDLGTQPVALAEHLRDVAEQAEKLREQLHDELRDVPWPAIISAAWWHDVGKSHPAFQTAMRDSKKIRDLGRDDSVLWAKSGENGLLRYRIERNGDGTERRRGFRHELASALAWLASHDNGPSDELIAYLIAAHHGKVRLSIRSMPNEIPPSAPGRLFARGVWDGDELPRVELGNEAQDVSETLSLSLELMRLGEQNGRPSWLERGIRLRDEFGPFRLAYLESLVRIADWRGTRQECHS